MKLNRSLPEVTLIIPWPRSNRLPQEFVDSILHQKTSNLEIIILTEPAQDITSAQPLFDMIRLAGWSYKNCHSHDILTANALFECISGRFVCFPEPDSILDPNFISTMSQYLEQHSHIDGLRCNGAYVDQADTGFIIDHLSYGSPGKTKALLPQILTRQTSLNVALWMMRTSSLKQVQFPPLSLRAWEWNWQFIIPFATQLSTAYIEKKLVKLIRQSPATIKSATSLYELRRSEIKQFSSAGIQILRTMQKELSNQDYWQGILRLRELMDLLHLDRRFRLWKQFPHRWKALCEWYAYLGINLFDYQPDLRHKSKVTARMQGIWTEYFGNLALFILAASTGAAQSKSSLESLLNHPKGHESFVIYGAGAATQELLEIFLALGLRPRVIWDRNATPRQKLFGVPVHTPPSNQKDSNLPLDECIIVVQGQRHNAEQIYKNLSENGFSNILHMADRQGAMEVIMSVTLPLSPSQKLTKEKCLDAS